MKLIITGYADHGKDTACEYLRDTFGFTFESSSEFCNERAVFPGLKDKYGYQSPEECFADKDNHRAEWHQLIASYNTPDKAKLGKEILSENDMYCGLRCRIELEALRLAIPNILVIWIDASERLPPEPTSSISIVAADANFIVPNNTDLKEFQDRLLFLIGTLADIRNENPA